MSQYEGIMRQSATGLQAKVYRGWNWPCFFFGAFWYLGKGMWAIGLLWMLLAIVTGSVLHWIGLLYMPAIANRKYREHLAARGYALAEVTPEAAAEAATGRAEQRLGYAALAAMVGVLWVVSRWMK